MGFLQRLITAWRMAKAMKHPAYAVVYDVPEIGENGQPTGDFFEEYYEAFESPIEAYELFRMAFREDDKHQVENARLVLILDPIDSYRGS